MHISQPHFCSSCLHHKTLRTFEILVDRLRGDKNTSPILWPKGCPMTQNLQKVSRFKERGLGRTMGSASQLGKKRSQVHSGGLIYPIVHQKSLSDKSCQPQNLMFPDEKYSNATERIAEFKKKVRKTINKVLGNELPVFENDEEHIHCI
ncbi:hypothetical protein NEOLI_005095 [Neolecta irregularis DAH-3]|uniref:Uncharacterized protein n=1 Tax=Neolecta irregularis (strain DAH-3) TaxID=1198029 RepID=A0A1U7LL24_NEOID|nr:hypothetical protein NEOLI_005095 [Neolecta irregularis DAH-3]|eukprot:OLL23242.1 hypothetical protein NEOLI_005095 [Neolecta irregularis DAH-3]